MWGLEQHPMLASTMGCIALLAATPDEKFFRNSVAHAVVDIEPLRQRVSAPVLPLADPEWEPDPDFDIDHHVRVLCLPSQLGLDAAFDTATQIVNDPFDRSRPPWSITLLTGLPDDRSVLVIKAHHSIADGQGLIRLGLSLFELEADADQRPPIDVASTLADNEDPATSSKDDMAQAIRGRVERFLGLAVDAVGTLGSPSRTAELAKEVAATAQLLGGGVVDSPSVSPLWRQRSRNRRSLHLSASLPDLRTAAAANACTVNDLFVVACVEAALGYHQANEVELAHVSTSVVISTRTDDHPNDHNAVIPCGIVVPGVGASTADRLQAVADQVSERRAVVNEHLNSIDAASKLAAFVPHAIAAATAVDQASKLDFATSNLPGPPVPLWLGGVPIEWMSPLGPVAGTAFNVTMLSFLDDAAIGVHYDPRAVVDAALLASELRSSLARLRIGCRIRAPRIQ